MVPSIYALYHFSPGDDEGGVEEQPGQEVRRAEGRGRHQVPAEPGHIRGLHEDRLPAGVLGQLHGQVLISLELI